MPALRGLGSQNSKWTQNSTSRLFIMLQGKSKQSKQDKKVKLNYFRLTVGSPQNGPNEHEHADHEKKKIKSEYIY